MLAIVKSPRVKGELNAFELCFVARGLEGAKKNF